jgi:hypothetical protein
MPRYRSQESLLKLLIVVLARHVVGPLNMRRPVGLFVEDYLRPTLSYRNILIALAELVTKTTFRHCERVFGGPG